MVGFGTPDLASSYVLALTTKSGCAPPFSPPKAGAFSIRLYKNQRILQFCSRHRTDATNLSDSAWVHPPEPAALVAIYRRCGTRRTVSRGQVLKSGGQEPRLFFQEKGLCAYEVAEELKGRPSVLSLITPRRTMGDITCLTGDVVNVRSVAWQKSTVLEVDPRAVHEECLLRPPLLLEWARHIMRKEESHLEGMVANFTLPPAMRLKIFLRVLFEGYGLELKDGENVVPLLLTADRIGSVVNLTRMSVSKLFSQWQREGLMIRHGQTSIVQSAAFCLPLSSASPP